MSFNATDLAADDAATDPILEIRDLCVTYEMDRGTSRVVNHVDLDIDRDEILGIVGESGSGKSMLASALLDAAPPPGRTSGRITFYPDDGDPVEVLDLSPDARRRFRWETVAMVFQGSMSSFNPTLKIRGHFEETIEAHDMDMIAQMSHAYRLLEDLYLDPERVLDSYPHELSGGMKQRTLIALSLVLEPDVLVMDEPTAALDLLMQRSIVTMLRRLRDEYDLTILFITHDLPLVAGLVDRLAVMYAFEIAEYGRKDDVLRNAAHPYTRALLNSVPSMQSEIDAMQPIPGRSPDPVNIPPGCSYHTRCPLADERCRTEEPSFRDVTDGQRTSCFHWEESAAAVPYSLAVEPSGGD